MNSYRAIIVIPARSASTRLAKKLLLRETGKSVLQHTYENACRSKLADQVLIAAGDDEIRQEAVSFGAPCVMTDPLAASGTDRVAEVARSRNANVFVNLQGDEPELSSDSIDAAIEALLTRPDVHMSTLATPIRSTSLLDDPACVKVIFDKDRRALYFSRTCIPFCRDGQPDVVSNPPIFFQHLGIYAYRRHLLLQIAQLPPSATEQAEKLEQLRALHAGVTMQVVTVKNASRGIDTLDDYLAFVSRMSA